MDKKVLYIFISIGGLVGGYIPILLGSSGISVWTVLGSTIGGLLGVFAAKRLYS